jgi:hypothetical protein
MTIPPTNLTEEGIRLLQQGDATGATTLLAQAIQNDPSNGIAYQFLGIARSQTGDPAGGIAALREAARLLPQSAGVHYNLGVALTQAQQADEAHAALNTALTLDPTNAKVRAALEQLPTSSIAPTATPSVPPLGTVGGMASLGGVAPAPTPAIPTGSMPLPVPPSAGYVSSPTPPSAVQPAAGPPPNAVGGMAYTPPAAVSPQMFSREPTTGQRILRGLGWGALYGQWWTLWRFISAMVWGSFSGHAPINIVVWVIEMLVIYSFVGSIAGLIIGAINGNAGSGSVVGIVAGLLCFGVLLLLSPSGIAFLNIFFWFITGRYVGANIARRVQERVGA